MSNFKKVIEIEKKYEHVVSTSRRKSEKDLDKFKEELQIKEDAIKQDYIKELENSYAKSVKEFNLEGEKMLKNSKEEADFILKNAKKESAIKLVLEEF